MVAHLKELLEELKPAVLPAVVVVACWFVFSQTDRNQFALAFSSLATGYAMWVAWAHFALWIARQYEPFPRGYNAYIYLLVVIVIIGFMIGGLLQVRFGSMGGIGFLLLFCLAAYRVGQIQGRKSLLQSGKKPQFPLGTFPYDVLLRGVVKRDD